MNKNIYLLVATNCINKVYDIFLGLFLVSFLFKQTEENISDIGLYHIICNVMVVFLAWITGNWMKRGNRLLMYQIGIIVTFAFFIMFIYLQDNIVNYIPFCGIACGFIISFKTLPFNLIVADNVPSSQMIAFKGNVESLKNIIRVVSPLLLGIFLTGYTYFNTIAFLAFMSVVEFIFFTQIKSPIKKELPRFAIKSFWQKTKHFKFLQHLYKIEFYRGMTIDGALGTLLTLYIINLFKTDFNLGLISSIFFGLAIILNIVFSHFCKYQHFVKILALAALMIVASVITFIFIPTRATLIIYNFCFIVVTQFLRIIADINMYNVSNLPEVINGKNEYFAVREMFLNFGRFVSYGLLIAVGILDSFAVLKYLLLFLTLCVVLMSASCIKINKHFLKTNQLK